MAFVAHMPSAATARFRRLLRLSPSRIRCGDLQQCPRLLAALAFSALSALPSLAHSEQPADPPAAVTPSAAAGQEIDLPGKTAWVKFLGWSGDSSRLAFRAGPVGTANRPGDPCTVLRVGPGGTTTSRLRVEGDTLKVLGERRIHSVKPARREEVTAQDHILGSGDHLVAVVVRDEPPELAILYRAADGRYLPVWRKSLAQAGALTAWAWPSPTGNLLAVAAEVSSDAKKAAFLVLVPTAAAPAAGQP